MAGPARSAPAGGESWPAELAPAREEKTPPQAAGPGARAPENERLARPLDSPARPNRELAARRKSAESRIHRFPPACWKESCSAPALAPGNPRRSGGFGHSLGARVARARGRP